MEIKHYLKFLKVSVFIVIAVTTHAQKWQLLQTIQLNTAPVALTTDFQGNLYLGFADGGLSKYNPDGKLLENFSLSNNSAITLIDVQNNLKPFLFYFDNQQITILDRFSTIPKTYPLSDLGVHIAMLACPAPDGNIWVLENNPQRLKKINPLRKITVLEVQLSIGDRALMMQAYQNFLFIGHEKGLHFFDQFGGFVKSLELGEILNFQISSGKIYAFSSNKTYQVDINKGEIESSIRLPQDVTGGLYVNDKYLFFESSKVLNFKIVK